METTETIRECIQCRDAVSGNVGTFGTKDETAPFRACTPVMRDLVEFYAWCKENKFRHVAGGVHVRVWRDGKVIS